MGYIATAQRVAVVDINKVLDNSAEYKKAQGDLDRTAAKWRQQISQEYDKIKGMYSKYQAEQVLMSEELRVQKEDEIMEKEKQVREMQREKFGPEGALFKKRQELVRPIQDKVYAAIEDFADVKGFDVVFDTDGTIIYYDQKYDKTDDILKELAK